ncbi:hypothetical protein BGZ73_002056 [Actinomortierella ambigua]|nr:hypothetical protein BGZ73_002056 [Actinomortierella ambigua]
MGSEHPFTLPGGSSSSSPLTLQAGAGTTAGGPSTALPATALPFATNTFTRPSSTTTATFSASSTHAQAPHDHVCESPLLPAEAVAGSDPLTPSAEIQYRLSKISSTSADLAAIRHAQQQAALQELKRIQDLQKAKLKQANENALNRLLGGLKDAVEDKSTDTKSTDLSETKADDTGEH